MSRQVVLKQRLDVVLTSCTSYVNSFNQLSTMTHIAWLVLSSFAAAAASTLPQSQPSPVCINDPFEPHLHISCPTASTVRSHGAGPNMWTTQPRCITWTPRLGPSTSSHPVEHCIFTQAAFRYGHGVTIIASPGTASDLVGSGALSDTESYLPLSISPPRIFAPGPVFDFSGVPAYEVRDLPGKGKGVIAVRRIEKGEVLMLDYPAILAAADFASAAWTKTQERLLQVAVSQLPRQTQRRVLDLAMSQTDLDSDMAVGDVFATNTCSVVLGNGVRFLGLFPEVSRMNHDCVPNAYYRLSPMTLTMQVVSYRQINPGEEVTINYASLGMPYTVRREYLEANYGFTCGCALCKAPKAKRAESDARRMRLARARQEMSKAGKRGDAARAIVRAGEALAEVAVEDGLGPLAWDFYAKMSGYHLELGQHDEAMAVAARALEGMVQLDGPDEDGGRVGEVRDLMKRIQRRQQAA
ncbi:hypothetical protein F5X68DRAFT_229346 [Plectosphaerella plurivora]|uniref:SET domain-containing protein n=1 Tax=Plectosphaerella plurivora TaxID=936078 RepID=A0A9P8VIJ2_9PEZI|nr:hypothetical protein F5X68DRAFT_229346 [Plectosphaerella plurivora]